tara:strand:- start:22361 stop:23080 length:720 start_codon:yes stop_codon:yes gene_type:complete
MIKKNILILGASSDIGVRVVKKCIENGYFVYAHYNSRLNGLSKFSKKNIFKFKSNFSNLNDKKIKHLVKKLKNKKISHIVNLIGYVDNINYLKSNLENLISSLKINSLIPNLIIKELLPYMCKIEFGRILNCSSIGVKFGGGKNTYNYSLSKYTLEFIPSYLRNLAKKNILTNNIRIGVTNTKLHSKIKNKKNLLKKRTKLIPIGRMAEIDEICDYIVFLISKQNSYLTNETITVSGGE